MECSATTRTHSINLDRKQEMCLSLYADVQAINILVRSFNGKGLDVNI